MESNSLNIAQKFQIDEEIVSCIPYGEGHINGTFLVETDKQKKYILQRINKNVFKKPEQVMENIVLVITHLKKYICEHGGDEFRECLTLVPTKDGKNFFIDKNGEYFRVYYFIDNATSYQNVENPIHFYCAAKAFGQFQNMLNDFPADKLHETIKDFHDTKIRYESLKKAISEDKLGRASAVEKEIEFALNRINDASVIMDGIANKEIPLRVTHNDTKFNNIMIDDKTGEGICVIDLDTVMPGSMLFDFGDSIRFGANHVEEDEHDLSKVYLYENLFEEFAKGFLESMRDSITASEAELLPFSSKLMTLECGIRFLTDYIEGDTYFKTSYDKQNLFRARTQFKLVASMEDKMEIMRKIVNKYI